jgi:plastocyanin
MLVLLASFATGKLSPSKKEGLTMPVQRIIFGSALLILAGCQTIGGESLPSVTRTGELKDVIIRDTVDPASLTVNAGDEIRWVNKRQGVVRVVFLNPVTENLACQRNFGGPLGFGTKRNEYSAKLRPNETASLCFRDPSEVKYVVRAESASHPGGEQNIAGTISIGSEDLAHRPMEKPVESNTGLAAHSDKDEAPSSQ